MTLALACHPHREPMLLSYLLPLSRHASSPTPTDPTFPKVSASVPPQSVEKNRPDMFKLEFRLNLGGKKGTVGIIVISFTCAMAGHATVV